MNFLLTLFLLTSAANAATFDKWPASLMRTELWHLPITVQARAVSQVIYGNRSSGFFKVKPQALAPGVLGTEIFPPGYSEPIEYFMLIEGSETWRLLGKRKYASPFRTAK